MELIIVILFFSIASVVCVQLFVNAYNTNTRTGQRSQSNIVIQNLAESVMGCDGDMDAVCELFNGEDKAYAIADHDLGRITIMYDAEWKETVSEETAVYMASIAFTDETGAAAGGDLSDASGKMLNASIEITECSSGYVIASQSVKHYIPYRLGAD